MEQNSPGQWWKCGKTCRGKFFFAAGDKIYESRFGNLQRARAWKSYRKGCKREIAGVRLTFFKVVCLLREYVPTVYDIDVVGSFIRDLRLYVKRLQWIFGKDCFELINAKNSFLLAAGGRWERTKFGVAKVLFMCQSNMGRNGESRECV